MQIRKATMADLKAIAAVEAACFPAAEAAKESAFLDRLRVYPDHFWLLEDEGRLVAFVNGMATHEEHLMDAMYENADMHDANGRWQMIFGVNTLPAYRRQGCAETLLRQAMADAKAQGRLGLVLTCKETLVPYYAKLGFKDEGISPSEHGGVRWHEMRLLFNVQGNHGLGPATGKE